MGFITHLVLDKPPKLDENRIERILVNLYRVISYKLLLTLSDAGNCLKLATRVQQYTR